MDIAQLLICHMGINLSGGDIGVTKESLDRAKVGAVR